MSLHQPKNPLLFLPLVLVEVWLAHALVFFAHEYAHSVIAWLLGWKSHPFALHYGQFSLIVLLAQFGINENVNYAPLFASGSGIDAGIIAAAGMVLGNMVFTYPVSRWLFNKCKQRGSRNWAMLFYLMTIASLGNFWDYVPIRTFGTDGDMHTIAVAFHCSPWWILFLLGLPTILLLLHFFTRLQTDTLTWLFPHAKTKRALLIVLTSFGIFGFYGAAGWVEDSGEISRWLSMISVCVLFPLVTLYSFRGIGELRITD